ncbi:Ig-like domain-containing protein [Pontibacter fetidus]|uniref:T9SS type A sorting domain-containing protein n=1 Tax=Pontibacter fetidus TaxID=2700082 RepID=A0A6B2H1W4_9BACT|nr:T9SS type A sorting domain-containing protein [Pontibacter fetidus]NDK54596.1 T9SS type A sorting domain-containing protein [Pontibacter fetidus]
MKRSFTQLISEVSKAKQFTFATATLLLLIMSAVYLRADVQTVTVSGGSIFPVSADLAANATLSTPGYTAFGDIVINEDMDGDFAAGTGSITLTAPTGWRFKTSGVTTIVQNGIGGNGNTNTNVTINNTEISYSASIITIPFTADKINQRDRVTIKGVEVQAINGGVLPSTGSIIINDGTGAQVAGFPQTLSKSLSQVNGAPRTIAFFQQPISTSTGTVISPSPSIVVKDQFGNTIITGTGSNALVTLAIANNPSGSNGTLSGTKTISAINGVATFAGLSIDNAGQGYTLTATSGTLTTTSSPFNITNKTPTIVSLSQTCSSVGDAGFSLTITGTEFAQGAKVRITKPGGAVAELDPASINAAKTQMVVAIDNTIFATAGIYSIRVVNKAAGQIDVVSSPTTFTVYENLAANAISGTAQLCAGSSATYTAPSGYTNYNWSVPASVGTITAGQGTRTVTIGFAATASGNVTLNLNAANACSKISSASFVVDVKPKPVVSIVAIAPEICVGGSATLTASGADSYVWSGNGVTTGTTGASITVSPTATTTYTAIGTTNGCESEAKTITIVVNPLPIVSIGALNAEYCSSDTAVPLTGSPSGGSFRVLQSGNEVASGASFDPSALGAGNYIIEYTYTDGKSCTNTTTKAVTVKQQPTISLTNDLEICFGSSATLNATGADSYSWSPATGLSATTGASVIANPTQTTTYTVIGTTDGCQSVAKTVTVTVNQLPDADITLRGPSVFCPENYVDLVAVSKPNFSYQWFRLNSNGSSTAVAASTEGPHVYSATTTGNYYVRITSDKGCIQTSETVAVQVANVPTKAIVSITGATTFCEGGSVKFSANQSPTSEPYKYQWQVSTTGNENDFTDIGGEEASSYIATTPGFYRVLVSNTEESTPDVQKCTKISDPVAVTVLPQPTAEIKGGNQNVCYDQDGVTSIFLEGTYSGGTHKWYSDKGDFKLYELESTTDPGTGITTSKVRIDHTMGGALSAQIILTSTNTTTSCTQAKSVVVLNIIPSPNATITANRPIAAEGTISICKGESVLLTANPGTGNYLWSNNVTSRTIIVSEPGTYTVKVISDNGCEVTSKPVSVIVNELPVVTIDTQLQNAYCKSADAIPLAGSPANGTFRILKGATVIDANATQLNPGALAAGTYTIEYSYTDGNTCINTATKTVTINALPVVNIIEPSKAAYCKSEPNIVLQGNNTGGTFRILNSTGGVVTNNASTFNPSTLVAGTYTIEYTYSDGNNCANVTTKQVTVNPLPTASITAGGPTTVCQGEAVLLTGNSDTGTSFTWFRNNTQVSTGATYSATTSGSYSVQATNSNSCTSVMSTAVQVTVNPIIAGNSISGTQTVCSGATIAPLGQSSGTSLSGGATPYSYQWQSSSNNTSWTNIATNGNSATYTPAVQNVTSQSITYYRRIVSGGSCSSTSSSVSVTVNPNPVISGFSLGTDSDSDGNGAFLDVYSGQGNITLQGNPTGGTFSGPGVSGTTFNPCTALGSDTEKTVTITYTRTSGSGANQCSTVISKTVRVKKSTYRAVVIANPHPFCRGVKVTYTTTIYRDLEPGDVIYPYLVDENGQPVYANGSPVPTGASSLPAPNLAYPFPPNTPLAVQNMAYRFFQPIVKEGLESKIVVRGNGETYQWGKNHEVERKNDLYYTTDAGLSSQDYYHVYVNMSQCGTVLPTLQSNRMYSAELPGYSATLTAVPNPICKNGSVTLTAELNTAFDWATANTTVDFVRSRGDVVLGSQPFTPGVYTYSLTTTGGEGGFENGDQVYLRFITDIEKNQTIKKCADNNRSNNVTINVVIPQAMTGGGAYCAGGAGVPVGLAGSQQGVSYQLLHNGSPVGSPVAGTGRAISFGNQTVAGAYTVQPTTTSGSACETFGTVNVYITPLPTAFTVTGGGPYCNVAGAVGVPVGLSGSQIGVRYQLLINNVASGTPVSGTGAALNFGNKTAAGTYTVIATTISSTTSTPPVAACPQPMTGSVAVVINPLPTVTVNSPTVCAGQNATITAVPAGGTGPYSYTWTVPSGATNPGNVASFSTTVGGTYTVRVTDSKSCASSAVATSTVTVNPLPTVTVNSPTTCQGTAVMVAATATGAGPFNYAWTVPNGVTNPGNVASFQTSVAGNYAVVVTDSKNCASASGTGTVTVTPIKVATGEVTADKDPIKINEPVTFTLVTDIISSDVRLITWYVRSAGSTSWGTSVASGMQNTYTMTPATDEPFEVRAVVTTPAEACYSFTEFFTERPIIPLPVELLYFKAEKNNKEVVLKWATASERDNEGFEVHVSQDGKTYKQLQFVPSKNGSSSIKQTYEFVDKENGKYGTRYYRLKQLDTNGEFAYYGPQMVTFGEVSNKVLVYPNPFEREVKLDVDAEKDGVMEVTLTNMMGKQLLVKAIAVAKGQSTATLDLGENLAPGVYIITTRLNGQTFNTKLLKR